MGEASGMALWGLYSPQGRRQRLLYLGGPGQEQLNQVQADAGGAWLVGWSHASPSADRDGLLARLNRTGVLQWEQRIGGSGTDALYGVWGTAESAWVVGQGNSAELPVSTDALQPVWGGGIDGSDRPVQRLRLPAIPELSGWLSARRGTDGERVRSHCATLDCRAQLLSRSARPGARRVCGALQAQQ